MGRNSVVVMMVVNQPSVRCPPQRWHGVPGRSRAAIQPPSARGGQRRAQFVANYGRRRPPDLGRWRSRDRELTGGTARAPGCVNGKYTVFRAADSMRKPVLKRV